MFQRRRLETRSLYRSVRYRVTREQFAKTADPTMCNFRIKKNSMLQTMTQTIDTNFQTRQQSPQFKDLSKINYLESFQSMMQRTDRIKIRFNPEKQRSLYDDRVTLPNFSQNEKQVQQSEHPLLTPFNKPYNHVKLLYLNCQSQLISQKNQCQQIKYGLQHIKQSKLKQLSEIQSLAKEHFSSLRSLLRKDQINQQQKKLKTKRQIKQLQEQHVKNRKLFHQIDQKSTKMQINLFNSTPFNLKQRGDDNNQIYF